MDIVMYKQSFFSRGALTIFFLASLLVPSAVQAMEQKKAGRTIDLTSTKSGAGLPQRLFVGSVKKGNSRSNDIAICHSPAQSPSPEKEEPELQPILIAYIASLADGGHRIHTPQGECKARDCTSINLIFDDANVQYTVKAPSLPCADRYGILKALDTGEYEAQLLETDYQFSFQLTLYMSNTAADGMSRLDLDSEGVELRCEIPEDHQHIRYGLGWYTHRPHITRIHYETDNDLYVCSGGELICVFSEAYMNDPANEAVIVANDLDNTIIGAGRLQVDQARYCNNPDPAGTGEPVPGLYMIDGWSSEWQAGFRLFGNAGHDWIIGGANRDVIYGGTGNDLLLGGDAGPNYLYGEEDRDVMHGGQTGLCDGGAPADDLDCARVGDPAAAWWPHPADDAGDCCCGSCTVHEGCSYSDMVPGATSLDIPPVPW